MSEINSIDEQSVNETETDVNYQKEVEQFGGDSDDDSSVEEPIDDNIEETETDVFDEESKNEEDTTVYKPNNIELEDENIVAENDRVSIPKLTEYEKVRMLGERAKQLSEKAKPLVRLDPNKKYSSMEIALLELKEKILPFKIVRPRPDGKLEIWTLRELEY